MNHFPKLKKSILHRKQNSVLTIETKYSRMDQVTLFKGCLPQILLVPFLHDISQLLLTLTKINSPVEMCSESNNGTG